MIAAVWKYELPDPHLNTIQMPIGSEVLAVAVQNNEPMIWVKVQVNAGVEERQFISIPTGSSFEDSNTAYRGTAFMTENDGSPFIVHVFEYTGGPRTGRVRMSRIPT